MQINLDKSVFGKDPQNDESNILVLPSKKRKTKVIDESVTKKKVLTKKQRKNMEKVVERKIKKGKVPVSYTLKQYFEYNFKFILYLVWKYQKCLHNSSSSFSS